MKKLIGRSRELVLSLLNLMSPHSFLSPSLYFMLGLSVGNVHSKELGKWILLSFPHYGLIHSPLPKNILYSTSSFPWSSGHSNHWFSFFFSQCFYRDCHIVWIIQHSAFLGGLLFLTDMHLSFLCVLPWLLTPFPFGIESYSTIWIYHSLSIHSSTTIHS